MGRRKRRRAHGQGSIWNTKPDLSGTWWIRWREGGKRYAKKFERREDAEDELAKVCSNLRAGRPNEVTPKASRLAELAEPWLKERAKTHRAWRDDRNRWTNHLEPTLGQLRPAEVTQATIRRLIVAKLDEDLSPQSVGNVVRLLSTFYSYLVEEGHARSNPAKGLPRTTRRMIKGTHDPKQTPFLEKQSDIARLYKQLAQPFATLFAVGALAGLRPGEIVGLEWGDVDLDARRMLVQRQVRHGKVGPTKSGKPRLVPIIPPLAAILAEWKLATGGEGLLFKPRAAARKRDRFVCDKKVRRALEDALKACELPETLTFYQCTRHTYASQHVMGGGSLATLREILGHSSVTVTERYAHLRPDLFKPEDLLQLSVSMSREGGEVIALAERRPDRSAVGHGIGHDGIDERADGGVSS